MSDDASSFGGFTPGTRVKFVQKGDWAPETFCTFGKDKN
jgi:hypothetical protein